MVTKYQQRYPIYAILFIALGFCLEIALDFATEPFILQYSKFGGKNPLAALSNRYPGGFWEYFYFYVILSLLLLKTYRNQFKTWQPARNFILRILVLSIVARIIYSALFFWLKVFEFNVIRDIPFPIIWDTVMGVGPVIKMAFSQAAITLVQTVFMFLILILKYLVNWDLRPTPAEAFD